MNFDLGFFAKQGFGYFLAAGELGVILYLFNKLINEKDKRLYDAKDYSNAIIEPLKNLQRSLDGIMIILQNAGKKQ